MLVKSAIYFIGHFYWTTRLQRHQQINIDMSRGDGKTNTNKNIQTHTHTVSHAYVHTHTKTYATRFYTVSPLLNSLTKDWSAWGYGSRAVKINLQPYSRKMKALTPPPTHITHACVDIFQIFRRSAAVEFFELVEVHECNPSQSDVTSYLSPLPSNYILLKCWNTLNNSFHT